jgi:hypothetical protein
MISLTEDDIDRAPAELEEFLVDFRGITGAFITADQLSDPSKIDQIPFIEKRIQYPCDQCDITRHTKAPDEDFLCTSKYVPLSETPEQTTEGYRLVDTPITVEQKNGDKVFLVESLQPYDPVEMARNFEAIYVFGLAEAKESYTMPVEKPLEDFFQ